MNRSTINRTIGIGAIFASFIAIRVYGLFDSCLWFDEIFGVHAASHSWAAMFDFVALDLIHPPLFYVVLKIWILIGGDGLVSVRLFPLFFAAASLIPFYFLCRDLKLSASQTMIAALFLAVNGNLIKYAQEVRMYSLFQMLALFSVWLFVRFFYLGKNIWLLTLINVLLVYTHYFGWLIVGAEIVVIIWLQRIKIRQTLIMTAICILAFAPWAVAVIRIARNSGGIEQNIGWIEKPGIAAVFNFAFDLIDPFYFQVSSVDLSSMFVFSVPILVIMIVAAILYFSDWGRIEPADRARVKMLGTMVLFPVLTAFAVSWVLPQSVWGVRHLSAVFAPLAILGVIMLTGIRFPRLRVSLVSLIAAAIAFAFVAHVSRPPANFIWCSWEKLSNSTGFSGPTTIYAFEDVVAYDLWFANRSKPEIRIVKINGIEGLTEDRAYFLPRGFSGVDVGERSAITSERFYIAFRDIEWNEKHPPLNVLLDLGYKLGEPRFVAAQGQKAFFVEVYR